MQAERPNFAAQPSSKKKPRGIGLLSGGLDSMLAVKILQEQQLDLIAITFVIPFFGPAREIEAGKTTEVGDIPHSSLSLFA